MKDEKLQRSCAVHALIRARLAHPWDMALESLYARCLYESAADVVDELIVIIADPRTPGEASLRLEFLNEVHRKSLRAPLPQRKVDRDTDWREKI